MMRLEWVGGNNGNAYMHLNGGPLVENDDAVFPGLDGGVAPASEDEGPSSPEGGSEGTQVPAFDCPDPDNCTPPLAALV